MSSERNEGNGLADGRQYERLENYTAFWSKDISKEESADTELRLGSYTNVVNGFYDGATELYENGWGKSFHFCRFYKGEGFAAAVARHEHYLAARMQLRPGMRVLDVGCGVGGPAREIGRFSDVEIIGVNNNEFQVQRARKYTKEAGLEGQVKFTTGDFMKLEEQFGPNYFDAVYAIEATCHAPTWEGVYGEIFKVLKPGGIFGVYEWCMTDDWDPSIPAHADLQHEIELGNGIPEMRPIQLSRQALKTVGFEILHEEDLADRGDSVPWYYPLAGDIRQAQTFWDYITVARCSETGQFVARVFVRFLELLRIAPKGTHAVAEALLVASKSLVRGGQMKLFTPMYLVVSKKPDTT
ncbi:delta-sterol C-methyltransferase [Mycena pura]|uniref:Delta-sterol C-methyltransferase n=1 Tax=Mycena pura TaxID=153505 RepID=A0AAD6VEG3_9AGAR|nr:delta-sterol C-methyltransferase [Mycena pura]